MNGFVIPMVRGELFRDYLCIEFAYSEEVRVELRRTMTGC